MVYGGFVPDVEIEISFFYTLQFNIKIQIDRYCGVISKKIDDVHVGQNKNLSDIGMVVGILIQIKDHNISRLEKDVYKSPGISSGRQLFQGGFSRGGISINCLYMVQCWCNIEGGYVKEFREHSKLQL